MKWEVVTPQPEIVLTMTVEEAQVVAACLSVPRAGETKGSDGSEVVRIATWRGINEACARAKGADPDW